LAHAFVIILQEDKVRKRKKIGLPVKKRHNFLIKRVIRIRRHVLSVIVLTTFSSNFSQFGPGAAGLELEMHIQLTYFLLSRNREKIKFGGIQVL